MGHDIFLQPDYLKALEEAPPTNISMLYLGFFNKDNPVGFAIVQRVQLYAKDVFRNNTKSVIKQFLKDVFSRILKGNLLVVGNLTHTGQHGIFIDHDKISVIEYLDLLFQALDEIRNKIKLEQKKKIRMVMLKDFFLSDAIHNEFAKLKSMQYHRVHVQPNMIMPIRSNWTQFGDYVNSMNTKYRTRYKRARKKLGKIICRELDLDTIFDHTKKLHELYMNVSNNASLNTFLLPQNHFTSLKEELKDNFRVFGYYLKNQLVGFYTLLINNGALETYFLGYDEEHQYKNQLYLNMLYDMAQFAIDNKFSSVVYARTAMEIKSSVGAIPDDMVMYMKHTNKIANMIFKIVFYVMNPKRKWKERHPFK